MIEVFADVWCPFAYVGLHLVRRRRDSGAPDVAMRNRAWPLELVNGAPMDVAKTARNIADLRGQLGVDLFDGFNPDTFPTTTLPALAVIAAAERNDAALGERAAFRVREALFEDGADIGRSEVTAALAAELGVTVTPADDQAVLDDWAEGQARGVKGSPHFFCGATDVFCPSLSISRDDEGQLNVAIDPSKLEAFLDACSA